MQIAQVLSGYSLGGADLLRRAMGKKIKAEMDAQRDTFVKGAVARGVPEAQASMIFDQVAKFAGYGFNKSHAAAYALVAYQTAYLKANYPVEFLAALMTFDLANTDKLNVFRQELDRLGVPVLPPDVNRSRAVFSVEFSERHPGGAVRYGLAAVKGVGLAAMDALVAERDRGGRFKDIGEFSRRLDTKQVNRRQLEQLVKAGAFDSLEANRKRVFEAIESMLRIAAASAEERESHQNSLFGAAAPVAPLVLAAGPDWPVHERLQHEFQAIGFYLSAHPLDAYAKGLKRLGVIRASELPARIAAGGSSRVKLAGTVIGKTERTSAKGNRFAFVQFSDSSGVFEVTLFSEILSSARELLGAGVPLLITADARIEEESIKLLGQSIQSLDQAVTHAAAGLRIAINDAGALGDLNKIIEAERRGRGRIAVVVSLGEEGEVEIALPGAYQVAAQTRMRLQSLPGVTDVQEF